MAHYAGIHHEQAAYYAERGQHEAAEHIFALLLLHPGYENGDIEKVYGDYGQLRGIEHERAAPRSRKAGKIEIHAPEAGYQQREYGSVVGHVGFRIDLGEYLRTGAFAAHGQRVHAARAAQHKAVHGAYAGNGYEQVKYIAQYVAEYVGEGRGSAVRHKGFHRCAARNAHIVRNIYGNYDYAADYERLRQVALGVLQFGIYAGCNYPAFVCKGRCANGAEQQGACACIAGEKILCRGKIVHKHVRGADKADYYAHYRHESERYKLYHGGGSLNLAGKLGGDGVHEVRAAHIEHHQRDALRPYHAAAFGRGDYEREIGPAGCDENEGIARAEPAENAGERGVINGRHEPAHIVAVLAADGGLGIVNYAVHLNVFLCHHGERQYAHQHYDAADYPRQYSQRKVAVSLLQYGLRLKEYARAYNDAYYHADSRK